MNFMQINEILYSDLRLLSPTLLVNSKQNDNLYLDDYIDRNERTFCKSIFICLCGLEQFRIQNLEIQKNLNR